METKNFLFLAAGLLLASTILSGCQTPSHNPEPLVPIQYKNLPPAPTPADQSFPQTLPQATVPPMVGNPLTVGVFLGPGAMRAYAHIGVLRALQRAQIPIVVIGGMEWGSIVAASYALGKGANEVEWEMMKLKKEQLPTASLLSRDLKPKDSQDLFNFLSSAFGTKDLGSGTIPFRCATTDGDQVEFISQGKARDQLVKCAALPPLYSFYERAGRSYISGALSPGDWPGELRKLGAQFIIYVDVVSSGKVMTDKRYAGDAELKALWLAVRATSKQQHLFANLTIEVPSDIDLSDYDHRRDAIALGDQAGQLSLNTLKQAIGLH